MVLIELVFLIVNKIQNDNNFNKLPKELNRMTLIKDKLNKLEIPLFEEFK